MMAKWTVGNKNNINDKGTLKGQFQYDAGKSTGNSQWQIYQDEKPFLEQAKREREQKALQDVGYRKFATIPDIVAIEIKQNFGIDIHNPEVMGDPREMEKFKKIIKRDYKYLLSF